MKLMTHTTQVLSLLAAGALAGTAAADEIYPFRVAFEDVPGVEEVLSGRVQAGITLLRAALGDERFDESHVLASLCGAHVLAGALEDAEAACNEAIELDASSTAYNNRGVLRAFRKELHSAQADFDRARPAEMRSYMAALQTRDIGLVANANHRLLEDLRAGHSPRNEHTLVTVRGAEPESLPEKETADSD